MDVDFDFSDVEKFFSDGMEEMKGQMGKRAVESVAFAKEKGTYQDRTGTLRNSNKYEVENDGVTLFNDAQAPNGHNYASNVESKGYEVLSSAALELEKNLKKDFE